MTSFDDIIKKIKNGLYMLKNSTYEICLKKRASKGTIFFKYNKLITMIVAEIHSLGKIGIFCSTSFYYGKVLLCTL